MYVRQALNEQVQKLLHFSLYKSSSMTYTVLKPPEL